MEQGGPTGMLFGVRYEFRAYGTREEIEAVLRNAYEAPGRSERRREESRLAAIEFFHGATEIESGNTIYVVEEHEPTMEELAARAPSATPDDDMPTPEDVRRMREE